MKILILLISLLMFSCKEQRHYTREEIITMLKSSETDSIMDACDYIIIQKDTSFYEILLNSPFKGGITHSDAHYGYNGYMARMYALKILTKKDPPVAINYKLDSLVIKFYRKLILKK